MLYLAIWACRMSVGTSVAATAPPPPPCCAGEAGGEEGALYLAICACKMSAWVRGEVPPGEVAAAAFLLDARAAFAALALACIADTEAAY